MGFEQIIVSLIVPYFYIVLSAIGLMYFLRTKIRIELALPVSLLANVIIVYLLTVILHNISLGIVFSFAFAIYALIRLFLEKGKLSFLKMHILTPGLAIFSILFIASFSISHDRMLFGADDYNQWGQHVKDMWLLNDFYNSPSNQALYLSHPNYPPAIQLFQIIIMKITGFYNENLIFDAQYILNFALFLPCLLMLKWRRHDRLWKNTMLVVILTFVFLTVPLLISLADQGTRGALDAFYSTLNVDSTLGSLFCFGLFIIFVGSVQRRPYFTAIILFVLSAFMVIAKEIAIIFVGIIWAYYILLNRDTLIEYSKMLLTQLKNRQRITRPQLLLIMMILLPIITFSTWQYQIRLGGHSDQFTANLKISEIPSILSKQSGTESQQCVARGFIAHLLIAQVPIGHNKSYQGVTQCGIKDKMELGSFTTGEDKVNVTYWQFWIITMAVLYLMHRYITKTTMRRQIFHLTAVLVIAFIGYVFILYNMYLFGGFSEAEQRTLASVDRYLSTYLFATTTLIFMVAIYVNIKSLLYFTTLLFAFLWVGVLSYSNFLSPLLIQYQERSYYEDRVRFAESVNKICRDKDHIWILTSDSLDRSMINYALRSGNIKLGDVPMDKRILMESKIDCLGIYANNYHRIFTSVSPATVVQLINNVIPLRD